MNENFGTLFLDSLKDGTYNNGLREKLSSISRGRHKSLEDSIDDDLQNQKSPPSVNLGEAKIGTLIDTVRLSTLGSLETAIPIWIHEIIHDHIPEQSEGNPSYYPEVPEYTVPKGRKYTSDEITRMQQKKEKYFLEDHLMIGTHPIVMKDLETSFQGAGQIHPAIIEGQTHYSKEIILSKGRIQHRTFSYPILESYVGYRISVFTDPNTGAMYLSHVYVYREAGTLQKSIDRIKGLDVKNTEDQTNTIHCLELILKQI